VILKGKFDLSVLVNNAGAQVFIAHDDNVFRVVFEEFQTKALSSSQVGAGRLARSGMGSEGGLQIAS
jgi:hypothetical protein